MKNKIPVNPPTQSTRNRACLIIGASTCLLAALALLISRSGVLDAPAKSEPAVVAASFSEPQDVSGGSVSIAEPDEDSVPQSPVPPRAQIQQSISSALISAPVDPEVLAKALDAEGLATWEVFHGAYPQVDPTDTDQFARSAMEYRATFPSELTTEENDTVTQTMVRNQKMRKQMILERARISGIKERGVNQVGASYLLEGFRGSVPLLASADQGLQDDRQWISVTSGDSVINSRGVDAELAVGPALNGHGLIANVREQSHVGQLANGVHVEFTNVDQVSRVVNKGVIDPDIADQHASMVGGVLAARGVNARARGYAPGATINSYSSRTGFDDLDFAMDWPGRPSRPIVGVVSGGNYGEEVRNLYGVYQLDESLFDQFMRDNPYYLHFISAGNYGHPPVANQIENNRYKTITVLEGKVAKNTITVGSIDRFTSRNAQGNLLALAAGRVHQRWDSSRGPTMDGRIKPDLMAGGSNIFVPDNADGAYRIEQEGATSAATPGAAGAAILLQDYFKRSFKGNYLRASSLMALMINTADDVGVVGPDYIYGWGITNVYKAAQAIKAHSDDPQARRIREEILVQGEQSNFAYNANQGQAIRCTLVWTDPAGPERLAGETGSVLVNDLEVELVEPGGGLHRAYVMPYTTGRINVPGQANIAAFSPDLYDAAATTGENVTDNKIQVYVAAPVAGQWTVRVRHRGALTGGSQRYSLVVDGLASPAVPLPAIVNHERVFPNAVTADVEVTGRNFILGATLLLRRAGFEDVPAIGLQVTSSSIRAKLDRELLAAGDWRFVVRNPAGVEAVSALDYRVNALLPVQWDTSSNAGVQHTAGTWNTANTNWTTDGGANRIAWAQGIQPVFTGAPGNTNVTLGSAITANGISLTGGAGTTLITATSASPLTLSGNLDVVAGATLRMIRSGNGMGFTGSFAKTGPGVLVLEGSSAGFNGLTSITVTGGSLALFNGVSIPTAATLKLNGGNIGSFSNDARVITSPVTIAGNSGIATGTSIAGGLITFSGATNLGGAARTLTVGAGGATFSGVISNGGIVKAGPGILTLSGANTYAGGTTVSAGTLVVGAGGSLGNRPVVRIENGSRLRLDTREVLTISELWINGVRQNDGVYNSANPNILGLGSLRVFSRPRNLEITTAEDTSLAIDLAVGVDSVPGVLFVFEVLTNPLNGRIEGVENNRNYIPNLNFNGNDSFQYRVTNGGIFSEIATVNIVVDPSNDAPSIDPIADQSVAVGESVAPIVLIISDVDSPAEDLVVTGASSNHGLLPAGNLVFGRDGLNRTVTLTPVANQLGAATVTITVADGNDLTRTTFLLTVTPLRTWDASAVANIQLTAGTWDSNSTNWTRDLGATNIPWTDGRAAMFSGDVAADTTVTLSGARSVSNLIRAGSGSIRLNASTGNTLAITGEINIDASNNANFWFSSANANGFTGSFNKKGAGYLLLDGGNDNLSFGTVTLTEGTLGLWNGSGLQSETLVLNGGVIASINANAVAMDGPVTLGGNVRFGKTSSTSPWTGSLNFGSAGRVDLGAGVRTVTTGSEVNFNGAVSNGGITKAGSSTLRLNGINTYIGATSVSEGTLLVNGSLANSVTTVNAAATLGGTGSIAGAASVSGTVDGKGNMTFGSSLNFQPGSKLAIGIERWNGLPQTNWSRIRAASLNVTSTQADPLRIQLGGSFTGAIDENKTFLIASAAVPIQGVTDLNITVVPPANDLLRGTWSASVEGNDLVIKYKRADRAPTATGQALQATAGTALNIVLRGEDLDGDLLNYEVLTQPAQGTLTGNAPNLIYTPHANYTGNDSFTFRVLGGLVYSVAANVRITVVAPLLAGADIGISPATGSTLHNNGTYTLRGAGADIWGRTDEFHFASTTISGNGEIEARVDSLQNTHGWAKAGVMIRESSAADSRHAMIVVTPTQGVAFQRRTTANGSTQNTSTSNVIAPVWLKMIRTYDAVTRTSVITARYSTDRITWEEYASTTFLNMDENVHIGLVVTSHRSGTLNEAVFSNVTVTP